MRFSHYDGKQPKQAGTTGGGGGSATPNHDYSLEEKVVGKWVDGTTDVYEKTYLVNNSVIESGFGATKQLLSASGYYYATNSNCLALPNKWVYAYVDISGNDLIVKSDDSTVNYNSNNYVTVRYIYKEV